MKKFTAIFPETGAKDILMTVCPACADQREGRLKAQLAVMKERFTSCTLIMADELDVYNMLRTHKNYNDAMIAARRRGNNWINCYWHRLQDVFGNNLKLLRWGEIKQNKQFPERRALMQRLYLEIPEVKKTFDDFANHHASTHCERWTNKGCLPDRKRFFELAIEYLLEEYTGLTVIRTLTDRPEVYAGVSIDPDFFNIHNHISDIDMSIPQVIRPELVERTYVSIAA